MIFLAYIILVFTAVQFLVALVNLITETHLPYTFKKPEKKVSVLIPARNEEKNIGNVLNDLKKYADRNIEIIVFNDNSEDRTGAIVREFVKTDDRFRLINSDHLPEGWLGKNYACNRLAAEAAGDYLLFLDADVRIDKNLIGDATCYAENSNSELVSIFPMQKIVTPGEWATVPNMNYILVSLLPLILVRKTGFPSLAAANGQFMMFNSEIYRMLDPHKKMKSRKVEDILIARYMKKEGNTVACLLGDERIACRMYSGYAESVNGFSKNVAEFFGGSHLLSIIFWLVTTFGFLVVLFWLPFSMFLVYLLIYLATRVVISLSGRQDIMKNILFILPLQISLGLFIVKSLTNKYFRKYTWKGREIS
jgi:glycosyltransferase involved in cell wall biosynthesis